MIQSMIQLKEILRKIEKQKRKIRLIKKLINRITL